MLLRTHEAGNKVSVPSSWRAVLAPLCSVWTQIKTFFFSLLVISKWSRSAARVTQRGTRCALSRWLNIHFSELWWIFFQWSLYSDQRPTLTLLLFVAQFHGADLVFFPNCKILFKQITLSLWWCLWFVPLPGRTFLQDWIHVVLCGIKSFIFSKKPFVSPHWFPKKQAFFFLWE